MPGRSVYRAMDTTPRPLPTALQLPNWDEVFKRVQVIINIDYCLEFVNFYLRRLH